MDNVLELGSAHGSFCHTFECTSVSRWHVLLPEKAKNSVGSSIGHLHIKPTFIYGNAFNGTSLHNISAIFLNNVVGYLSDLKVHKIVQSAATLLKENGLLIIKEESQGDESIDGSGARTTNDLLALLSVSNFKLERAILHQNNFVLVLTKQNTTVALYSENVFIFERHKSKLVTSNAYE